MMSCICGGCICGGCICGGGAGAQMMSSAADGSAGEQKGAQMMSSACERCTSSASTAVAQGAAKATAA